MSAEERLEALYKLLGSCMSHDPRMCELSRRFTQRDDFDLSACLAEMVRLPRLGERTARDGPYNSQDRPNRKPNIGRDMVTTPSSPTASLSATWLAARRLDSAR